MLKFTPKEINDNVNISKTSPIKDFFVLLGGFLGILIIIYILLGLAVGLVVTRLPKGLENRIGTFLSTKLEQSGTTEIETKIQHLLDELIINYTENEFHYKIHVVQEDKVNAFALAGGHIVIFSGLIETVKSENELAFVLAHELGHFANRDHLHGFGRKLVLLTLSTLILGNNSDITQTLVSSLGNVEMKFSQRQESAADLFAVELVNNKYGNVEGVFDFFVNNNEENNSKRKSYFFASHPHPEKRIEIMKKYIRKRGFVFGTKTPLKIKR